MHCKLCLREVDSLGKSHILPTWAYKPVRREDSPNRNPILVAEGRCIYASTQVTEPLLCRACEARFSPHEDYVSRHCWQKNGVVPLLKSATNQLSFGSIRYVDLPNIDRASLAYFAASVIYRASITKTPSVHLGAHEESLRRYLLEEAPFPEDARCLVAVLDPEDRQSRVYCRIVNAPSSQAIDGGVACVFAACGVTFQLFVGKALNPFLSQLCIVHSGQTRALVVPWNTCGAFLQTGQLVVQAGAPRVRK